MVPGGYLEPAAIFATTLRFFDCLPFLPVFRERAHPLSRASGEWLLLDLVFALGNVAIKPMPRLGPMIYAFVSMLNNSAARRYRRLLKSFACGFQLLRSKVHTFPVGWPFGKRLEMLPYKGGKTPEKGISMAAIPSPRVLIFAARKRTRPARARADISDTHKYRRGYARHTIHIRV